MNKSLIVLAYNHLSISFFDWLSVIKTIVLHVFIVTYFAWGFGLKTNPVNSGGRETKNCSGITVFKGTAPPSLFV